MQASAALHEPGRLTDPVLKAEADRLAMVRLLAVAGHDLKQPLQVARSALALADAQQSASARSRYMGLAKGALERLSLELEDLARSSHMPDDLSPKKRAVAVSEILSDVASDWRHYAEACGVGLRFVQSRAVVQTDPAMLKTILRNLVGNALKFSSKGGRVLVGCRRRCAAVSIEVHDTGPGIGAARLTRIFQAFERFDDTGAVAGLGLGLAIVRRTADMLQVPIEVRSTEHVGSIFSIELPTPGARGATPP